MFSDRRAKHIPALRTLPRQAFDNHTDPHCVMIVVIFLGVFFSQFFVFCMLLGVFAEAWRCFPGWLELQPLTHLLPISSPAPFPWGEGDFEL